MMFGLNSFQARVIGWGVLVGAVVMALNLVINLYSIDEQLERQIQSRIHSTETAYQAVLVSPLAEHDYATLNDIAHTWQQADALSYLVILNTENQALVSIGIEHDAALPEPGTQAGNRNIRFNIDSLGQVYGTVQYGISTTYLTGARNELILRNGGTALFAILLFCILQAIASRHIVEPLLHLGKAAERIAGGDYDIGLKATGLAELDHLSNHFSNMALSISNKMSMLEWQAQHDALTQIYNRRAFENHVAELLANPAITDVTMLYIDLDQFKAINDSCGHAAGDELLTRIAHLLETRIENAFVARIGGDEFGAILTQDAAANVRQLAQGIIDDISRAHFIWDAQTYRIGASIGIASSTVLGNRSLKELMIAADTACFGAKELGRNRIQVYLPDDEYFLQRREELRSVAQLDSALADGRFVLYHQRLTLLTGDKPTHTEILLRIKNAEGKDEPPASFIHAAERYNLMPHIDRWVVEKTCQQIAQWQKEGREIPIERFGINVSGSSLSDERFPDFVLAQIEATGVDPKQLCFEITESSAVSNLKPALNFIESVRRIGSTVALDDFGSGLSSFAYLKRFHADYLKVDGVFVNDIDSDLTNFSTVQAIVTLARAHQLHTVAEFVHSASILEVIRDLGVDYAQGFYLHKPEPLATLGKAAPIKSHIT
jgi:diguanylate cyclase (GGDEF)-like protein